jgi:hypothetical protein
VDVRIFYAHFLQYDAQRRPDGVIRHRQESDEGFGFASLDPPPVEVSDFEVGEESGVDEPP